MPTPQKRPGFISDAEAEAFFTPGFISDADAESFFGSPGAATGTPASAPGILRGSRGHIGNLIADIARGAADQFSNQFETAATALERITPGGGQPVVEPARRIEGVGRVGAFATKMVPSLVAAAATGGASLPLQAVAQGAAGVAQAGLEGAGPAGMVTEGVLQAALPAVIGKAVGSLGKAGGGLSRRAENAYLKALAPTTQAAKKEAMEVVPGLIKKNVYGGLEKIAGKAEDELASGGAAIAEKYAGASGYKVAPDVAAVAGTRIPVDELIDQVEGLKGPFRQLTATGEVAFNPSALAALDEIQGVLKGMGGKTRTVWPVNLQRYKQTLDDMISGTGGFTKPLTPGSAANISKQVRTLFRDALNKAAPGVEDLNDAYHFWKGVQSVVEKTQLRQVGQKGTVENLASGALGGGAGALTLLSGADPLTGGMTAVTVGIVNKLMQTPLVRTWKAVQYDALADLMIGNAGVLKTTAGRQVATVLGLAGIRAVVTKDQPKEMSWEEVSRLAQESGMSPVAYGDMLKKRGIKFTPPTTAAEDIQKRSGQKPRPNLVMPAPMPRR